MENQLQKFDRLSADIKIFLEPCMAVEVSDPKSCELAIVGLRELKVLLNRVEEVRTGLVKPLNDEVKKINAYAKKISEPLGGGEMHLKKQLGAWEINLERERQKALKEAEEKRKKEEAELKAKLAAEKEEAEAMSMFMDEKEVKKSEIIANAQAERSVIEINEKQKEIEKEIMSNKVSGARKIWKCEIVDESLVPREFLVVDQTLVRKAMMAGAREIPGVRIYQDTVIAAV